MIAIIHRDWDSDIVLEKGELENLVQGDILSGEIANYDEIGDVYLSKNENEFATALLLEWNIKESKKYHFKITSSGIEGLEKNNYIHGRYENGLNGSKLSIYGPDKDNLTKENIEFAIQMIKLNKEDN
jgi:hypothetical protein